MSSIVLPKKYTDVEIKDCKWVCPDCSSCVKITCISNRLWLIKKHIQSKKHQRIVEANTNPSEDEILKQQISTMQEEIETLKTIVAELQGKTEYDF